MLLGFLSHTEATNSDLNFNEMTHNIIYTNMCVDVFQKMTRMYLT